ncbi:MAG: M56 family metallopeptidase [Bacteroidales bacterium]|nr:M56 family metallopeptidase [Bacteroidales bacterium]
MKNTIYFRSARIFLNSSVILSSILPLLQLGLTDLLSNTNIVNISQDLPVIGIIYNYQTGNVPLETSSFSLDWTVIVTALPLTGSTITFLIYMYKHIKIKSLLRRSTGYLQLENGLDVVMSDEMTIPFIYFKRIVIPSNIDDKDLSQVISHEITHYQKSHYLDNVLFSLFHAIFWFNPFYLLLRNAQQLYHEFQVDDLILSTGVDPVSYKLSLIKYSVGHKLYSLANGLSNTNTKTRLQMINNIHIKKGKWRLYVLLPIMAILFTVICFANIEPKTVDIQSNALTNISQDDTLKLEVEFIDPFQGPEGKDVVWLQEGVIVVLMNRNSDIMIDREELLLADVEEKIISVYSRRIEQIGDYNTGNYPEGTDFGVKIAVSKDIKASIDEYQKMCNAISTALFKLREKYSNKLFDADYGSLTNSENQAIDKLIPFKIYGLKPDKDMHQNPNK